MSWEIERGLREESGGRVDAAGLASSILEGRDYAWPSERRTEYLRDLVIAEHRGATGEQLARNLPRYDLVVGSRPHRLLYFPAFHRGLLMHEPEAAAVRLVSVEERTRLIAAIDAAHRALHRPIVVGDFGEARSVLGDFYAGHGALMADVRNAAQPGAERAAAEGGGLHEMTYLIWILMARVFDQDRFVARAYRVMRHGGRRNDTWKLVCATLSSDKAQHEYSKIACRGQRGGVRLVEPGGVVRETVFETGYLRDSGA